MQNRLICSKQSAAEAAIHVIAGGLDAMSPVVSRWQSQWPLCTASSTYAPTRRSLSTRFGWPLRAMPNRTLAVAPTNNASHNAFGGAVSAVQSACICRVISRAAPKGVNANSAASSTRCENPCTGSGCLTLMVEARDDTLHHGWMTVASEFGPLLQANSLDSFEKV